MFTVTIRSSENLQDQGAEDIILELRKRNVKIRAEGAEDNRKNTILTWTERDEEKHHITDYLEELKQNGSIEILDDSKQKKRDNPNIVEETQSQIAEIVAKQRKGPLCSFLDRIFRNKDSS